MLQRIYFNSKSELLGFSKGKRHEKTLSRQAQKIQRKIRLTTDLYMRDKSDLLLCRLPILHKQLIDQDRLDKHEKYMFLVIKLNKMDYSRASRSFYAELKSKNSSNESFGPIRNESGQLSTNLHGCLNNWVFFYSELYTNTLKNGVEYNYQRPDRQSLLTEMRAKQLNAEISTTEIILAINTLKDYSTPGKDMLLSST